MTICPCGYDMPSETAARACEAECYEEADRQARQAARRASCRIPLPRWTNDDDDADD